MPDLELEKLYIIRQLNLLSNKTFPYPTDTDKRKLVNLQLQLDELYYSESSGRIH